MNLLNDPDHHKAANRCHLSLKFHRAPFTTHSASASHRGLYSPPQNNNKERQRLCPRIAAQFIYNAICDNLGRPSGNSAEIVPLMKTNWRNQGSFLLPSQEAIPNNMKLPKPRSSFAQRRLKSVERTMKAKAKWGFNPIERRVPVKGVIMTTVRHIYAND